MQDIPAASGDPPIMKFVALNSRGGNYLVVASNIAWLRAAENGQTTVGIVGGQPLLVTGSIEEVAQKILEG
jgi:periplasmic protein TonB